MHLIMGPAPHMPQIGMRDPVKEDEKSYPFELLLLAASPDDALLQTEFACVNVPILHRSPN